MDIGSDGEGVYWFIPGFGVDSEDITVYFGDHDIGIRNIGMEVRGSGVGVRNTMASVGNVESCTRCELGLKNGQLTMVRQK